MAGTRNRLYVSNPAANTVTYLDVSSDALPAVVIPVANPISIAVLPDGTRAYVSSASVSGGNVTSRVIVINAENGSVRSTIPLSTAAQVCASNPFELSIAAAADSSRVYVGNCDVGDVAIIQTSNDTMLLQMPAPASAAQPSTVDIAGASQSGSNTTYTYTLISGNDAPGRHEHCDPKHGRRRERRNLRHHRRGQWNIHCPQPFGVTASSQHGRGRR